jgi:3-oxocholest-4-en-26-oate---CoA ligase
MNAEAGKAPTLRAGGSASRATFNVADLWEMVAASVPDRVAVIADDRELTYRELDERADRLAAWLRASGLRQGSRVGVMMRNDSRFLESYLAAYKVRAVPINVNFRATAPELDYLAKDSGVRGLIFDPEFFEVVAAVAHTRDKNWWLLPTGEPYESALEAGSPRATTAESRSDDDEYVIYTGGTTGNPKGVVWRMVDAFHACLGGGDPDGIRGPITRPAEIVDRITAEPIVFMPVAPLMHAAGQWPAFRWLLAGGTVVVMARFDPARTWRRIGQCQVNVVNIVADAMARPLLEVLDADVAGRLSALRLLASGGAPLSDDARHRLATALPSITVRDIYGSSETGVQGWADWTTVSTGTSRFKTFDTMLVDPRTHRPLARMEANEGFVARYGHVPLGYHGDPEASARVFTVFNGTRVAITGDMGRIDNAGQFTLLGRGSDCINTGGEKVYPREVEEALLACPGLDDAMVVGRPHPRWGQQVVALVVPKRDVATSDADLDAHCRTRLAGYKIPRRYVYVASIQRRPNGKPDHAWANSVIDGARASGSFEREGLNADG